MRFADSFSEPGWELVPGRVWESMRHRAGQVSGRGREWASTVQVIPVSLLLIGLLTRTWGWPSLCPGAELPLII